MRFWVESQKMHEFYKKDDQLLVPMDRATDQKVPYLVNCESLDSVSIMAQ
jgi:hypothetical protein